MASTSPEDTRNDPIRERLGDDLEAQRGHLKRLAGRGLGRHLSAKVGASDVVQDTFLQARRRFSTYRGRTTAEWIAWLERIMHRRLANVRRFYLDAGKRQAGREVPIDPAVDDTQVGLEVDLADTLSSPGANLVRREQEVALCAALAGLPEPHRKVIRLHHEEGLTFEEAALEMGISAEAARKTWGRAMLRLRASMGSAHAPR